ncbi:Ebp2-domain-containing protein [Serendipita vermifera]|nr:Ebp2-domain-containing protein [Serendipita vermifera]
MPSKPLRPLEKGAKSTKKASIAKQSLQKVVKNTKKVTKKGKPPVQSPEPSATSASDSEDGSEISGDDDEDDDESNDIDEAGMARLMKHFQGEELDDIAKYQLGALGGEDEEDWESQEEGDLDVMNEDEEDEEDEDEDEDEDEGIEEDEEEEDEVKGDVSKAKKTTTSKSQPNGTSMANLIEEVEEVDLEDASSVDEDAIVRQKVVINNTSALERIRQTIQLDPSLPWTETLTVTYDQSIEVDVNDDLNRELAFYKQGLHGATTAQALAKKHNLPFTRPADFYAEMVKSDSHMERIRQRLLDETAGIKRSEDKRREREGKKFGKKVQVEKLKEREREKKNMEERIRGLKRKRKDALDGDEFDVQLEDALGEGPRKRHAGTGKEGKPTISRSKRDSKYGFGGKVGRRAKQNTKDSTDSFGSSGRKGKFGGGGGGKGKGKKAPTKRLGKSRRMKGGGR